MKPMLSLVPQKTAFQKASFKVQTDELPYVSVIPVATPYAQTTALNTTLAKDFPEAVTGSLSVAALADKLTKDVNAVLANGKKLVGK
jgi:multiple sugar transport system substrate-binding protein